MARDKQPRVVCPTCGRSVASRKSNEKNGWLIIMRHNSKPGIRCLTWRV